MTTPTRVALCGGSLCEHDAVSQSLQLKLDLLRRWREDGRNIEAQAFVVHADRQADDVNVVPDAWSLVRDDWFASAAIRIYEFGIYYPLFDSVFVETASSSVCIFHNVTPAHLIDSEEVAGMVERSMVQMQNIAKCDEALCDSEFNVATLAAAGIEVPASVLPLPPHLPCKPRGHTLTEQLSFVFVGRFVRAKGLFDLLSAFAVARRESRVPMRLTLAGNARFSDRNAMTSLLELANELGVLDDLRVEVDLVDDEMADILAASDVLVLPSYHEGYGVPVMEGLAAGCEVLVSDAGALPETAAGLGTVVRAGDINAIASAMIDQARRWSLRHQGVEVPVATSLGELDRSDWVQRVQALCTARGVASYEQRFFDVITRAGARAAQRGATTEAA